MSRSQKALDYYFDGFNCAQSVIASFADTLHVDEEVALRMASGFGGGMGRMQKTCGAVTGAFMVIGFLRGKYKIGEEEGKSITNELIQDFTKKYTERFGSINCKALIEFDLNTEEGRNQAEKEDVFFKKCSNFVKEAVELLEEVLND